LELVVFWAGECVQQPVNTPACRQTTADSARPAPSADRPANYKNDGRALAALPDGLPGITQIGWVPIPRTIEVMLLAWTSLATAAAVTTMAKTRGGTRRSGMSEGPVLNA